MDASDNNLAELPVMLSQSQIDLLRQLVADRREAMVTHIIDHDALQDDPEIRNTLDELSDLDIALTNQAARTGGGPDIPGTRFNPQELADIQRYAMYGMTAVEQALMNDSKLVLDPRGILKDRGQVTKDLSEFRPVFGKLTVAYLSGSKECDITKRLKD